MSNYLKKHKMALLLGLIFLLVACGPSGYQTGVGETAMRQIYNRVNNGSLDAWSTAAFWAPLWWAAFAFSLCLVGGLMMGGVSGASFRHHSSRSGTFWAIGCSGGAMFGFFMALVVFLLARSSILNAAPEKAEKQANHAIVEGIDQAKYDKANTFVEVLHTPVVDTTFERLECKKSVNTRSNCAPWEWTHEINHRTVCDSYDDDGRCTSSHTESDTEHVPYFTHMVRYLVIVNLYEKLATSETGLVSSGVENYPKMYLSEWLLPQDYDNHWYGYARPLFMQIEPLDYTPPADWQRYHSARLAGQVSLMNVYHRYPNWILITDNVYASGSTPDAYKAAGLLPGMNSLYSRIGTGVQADYDFVTFLNIETSQEMYYAWQDAAAEAFTFFANDRQASLAVIFAPEGQVENLGTIDDWANALKANYDQRNVWFITLQGERMQRMLPKNLFILACTVANAQIMECRLKSGMPTGNEYIMEAFSRNTDEFMADRSFTPEAFFGQIEATLVPSDGSYPVVQLHGVGQNIFGMTMREDPHGIRRISMTAFEYLKADVHLDVADINRLVAKEVGVQKQAAQAATLTAFLIFGGFWVLVFILFVMSQNQRR